MRDETIDIEEARALRRLAWKPSGTLALAGPQVSRDEEVGEAEADLRNTLPLLIDRERARRDDELRTAAKAIADGVKRGHDVDDDMVTVRGERYAKALVAAQVHDEQLQRFEAIADEKRATLRVAAKAEPRVYDRESPWSFYLDLAIRSLPGHPAHDDANRRMARYGQELAFEARQRTPEGVRAARAASTSARETRDAGGVEHELRAMSTGASSGGPLVAPAYLAEIWGNWHAYQPVFAQQAAQITDLGYGIEMNVPVLTSAPNAGIQGGENTGVPGGQTTSAYVTTNLQTVAGEVDISQQLYDRSGPVAFDTVVHLALMQQVWANIDAYTLNQALANAGVIADSSAFSVADFWQDLAKAKAAMRTTDGTKMPPSHLFLQPNFYEYALSQADPNGRPLLLPHSGPAPIGSDGQPPAGFTGERVLSTPAWVDGNIANYQTTYTQVVLAAMSEVFSQVTEPVLRTIPETMAQELTVVCQVYCYAGALVRHSAAVQVVTGSAYPASPSFA